VIKSTYLLLLQRIGIKISYSFQSSHQIAQSTFPSSRSSCSLSCHESPWDALGSSKGVNPIKSNFFVEHATSRWFQCYLQESISSPLYTASIWTSVTMHADYSVANHRRRRGCVRIPFACPSLMSVKIPALFRCEFLLKNHWPAGSFRSHLVEFIRGRCISRQDNNCTFPKHKAGFSKTSSSSSLVHIMLSIVSSILIHEQQNFTGSFLLKHSLSRRNHLAYFIDLCTVISYPPKTQSSSPRISST